MEGARYAHKRSHSQFEEDSVDRSVRQRRRGGFERTPEAAAPPVDDVVYRILCPGAKIGSVIGKGGSIIKSLRNETGAKIKVADGIPGSDERVIFISPRERREGKPRGGSKEMDKDKEQNGEESTPLPASQEALFKVFARIVEGEEFDEDEDSSRNVTARLLVPSNQIGCLLGKAGKIIEQMRVESGAQIRVLPREQLPKCAYHTDELVQLTGELALVKKALTTISTRLYDNPPRDKPPQAGHLGPFQESTILPGTLLPPGAFFPQGNASIAPGQLGGHLVGIAPHLGGLGGSTWSYGASAFPLAHGLPGGGRVKDEPVEGEFAVRLLCPNEKIGSVIGKGGMIIRSIREETCARIKIADAVANAEERVIHITSNEVLHEQVSPALEAVLQLQSRISDPSAEKDGAMTTRFLVPSANIGCLLGKKGSIIADMRRNTRANIRVLSKEALPKCAHEDDELVQVVGDITVARDAVIEIITRLRANIFSEHMKNVSSNPGLGVQGSVPVSSTYEPRHEPSPGMFSLPGLGSQGLRSSIPATPRNWGLQGAAGGLGALSYVGSTPTAASFGTGRAGSGLVASVAGTTIEITIPGTVIGSIIGKGGSNIAQIRQISGAKVKLHDPKPGSDKRIIEISGAPDQTQAAQSLLEAFMFTAQTQATGLY
ncbi:KH domain-containing protein HEN4 isoform X1 [Selaginella moellendorffii]|uniref:KH domain-containing protein HEN4 isoform X1 n=1 Tax=Selaginella moellendorffii TaxID=88036 RepID=UPI000D1C4EF0|nr:KH domain-containing protein HEN4 isoform X1 [Selaginella moellendorffii]XP_024531476.1 KH domain-containing protein HEN4 isoform X1 [Selaginella moellendorffii]|eukprot:XP_024531470.1 KH domain-containing protein HEN4 isoform X1 [Selaginella moellendorffii]